MHSARVEWAVDGLSAQANAAEPSTEGARHRRGRVIPRLVATPSGKKTYHHADKAVISQDESFCPVRAIQGMLRRG